MKFANSCLEDMSDIWNCSCIAIPKNKVKKIGKKKNFNNILGLFLLILARIKQVTITELKKYKINM